MTNSELKARFARLGPVRDAAPLRSFSDDVVPVLLRRTGAFRERIRVADRLRAAGVSLRSAHAAITRLAADGWAMCDVPADGGIDILARDIVPLDVQLLRTRTATDPASFITSVRDRHRLSQRAFATALGIDMRTLQNWEQGRNRPDGAVLSLVALFDRDPDVVLDVTFEAAPTTLPVAAQ